MSSFKRPRGTRDFGPEETAQRRVLQDRLQSVFERYGYQEVQTPTFEHLELFTAKSGDEIIDQLYDFQDKSERDLTLRPELTAPVIRFYNQELIAEPKPLRLWYFGNCFRYERPQSGRYREFWQFGAELLGAPGPAGDAEIIAIANACANAAGADTILRIGHIGILRELVNALPTDEETKANIYRLIDKGDEELPDTLAKTGAPHALQTAIQALAVGADVELNLAQDADAIQDAFQTAVANVDGLQDEPPYVGDAIDNLDTLTSAFSELEATLVHLSDHGLDTVRLDLGVARGLDYYTGIVFEIEAPELGAESQVAGGGRYQLAETLGGQPADTTGFGLGFDRILLASDIETDASPATVHVTPIGDEAQRPAARLTQDLREAGLQATIDLRERSISKNLDYANRLGIPNVILLGSNELDEGVATVKDMATGDQREVPLEDLADELSPS